jgi:hypothetical protein
MVPKTAIAKLQGNKKDLRTGFRKTVVLNRFLLCITQPCLWFCDRKQRTAGVIFVRQIWERVAGGGPETRSPDGTYC